MDKKLSFDCEQKEKIHHFIDWPLPKSSILNVGWMPINLKYTTKKIDEINWIETLEFIFRFDFIF